MKKLVCFVITVVLLFSVLVTVVNAEEETTVASERSKLALDMVLVIDESGSMSADGSEKNDLYGYRHDAAAALISLCDAEHSRVALLPFSTSVISSNDIPGVNELRSINIYENGTDRANYLKMLLRGDGRTKEPNLYTFSIKKGGNTDLGGALERAVELLVENKSENRPVIVLLSDGDIMFGGNNATQLIRESEQKFRKAVDAAVSNDIKIYSVALKLDSKLMKSAADDADGLYFTIDEPIDMPEVFNQIFADLVGSDVVTLTGTTEDKGNGVYKATFTIPNKSIAEANILLPVGESGSVRLYAPGNDKRIIFDDSKYLLYSSTYFSVVKILNPNQTGDWVVEYTQNTGLKYDQKNALGKISINVIFSYDVAPVISMKSEPLHKLEENTINVRFEKNGTPADDEMLYSGGIEATLTVADAEGNLQMLNLPDGTTNTKLTLAPNTDCFSMSFVPKNLITDIHGGEYTFKVAAKGEGMDDVVSKVIMVENLPPAETRNGNNVFADCEIHDPRRMDYMDEKTASIDLTQYVTEPDGEEIMYAWLEPEGSQLLDLISLENGILTLKTKDVSGTTNLKVSTYDAEGAETILTIPCKVTSIRDQIKDEYRIVITSDGETAVKGDPYTYTAVLKRGDEIITDSELLDLIQFNLHVQKDFAIEGKESETEDLVFTRDGSAFHATAVSSKNECTYSLNGTVVLKDIVMNMEVPSFARANQGPVLAEGNNPFAAAVIHDPRTENYADEFKAVLDLNEFAKDPDGEPLHFSITGVNAENDTEVVKASLDEETGKMTLETVDLTGSETIQITARDPEGVEVVIDLPIQVENNRTTIQDSYYIVFNLPAQIAKDQDYEIEAIMKNGEETISDPALLALVDLSGVELVFKPTDGSEETREPINAELTETGWKAQKHSGLIEGQYAIEGSYFIQNGGIVGQVKGTGGSLGNKPPVIVEEHFAELQHNFEIEPFLWRKLNETEYTIEMSNLFSDPSDKLNYVAKLLPEKISEGDEALSAEDWFARGEELETLLDDGKGQLVLSNEKAGDRKILMYATDQDNKHVSCIYDQKIISQKNEVIILLLEILAGIVAVILLIIAWYWLIHRKSWNMKHGSVSITVNHVPRPNKGSFPMRGKQDVKLNTLRIADVATGEMNTQLAAYTRNFKLRAGADGKVYVTKDKVKQSPFSMIIGTTPMNKNTKRLTWDNGAIMTIKNESASAQYGSILIEIKREGATGRPMSAGGIAGGIKSPATPTASPVKPAATTQPAGGGINRPKI